MASFIYRHPILYKLMLRAIHRRSLYSRYRFVSKAIGRNKRVFELGCGTAFLHGFLHRGCRYTGWDLNKRFVEHCRGRGIDAMEKDIFDFKDYPENDVTVVCDVLHHVFPKDIKLIDNAMKKTKKMVIIEPYHSKPRIPEAVLNRLEFLDEDGVNNDKTRYMWNLGRFRELLEHFRTGFSVSTRQFGVDMIAVLSP